ncbi:hypothetical protein CJ030_MR0G005095 [Morella rubra]|uniref:Uncharacterized protein n=1 Tax=Morella rubra TaxID=262757 RepID=A0A6A1UMV7_9ROSI|nr:hypothetical protein CJ030_MR0G005095 [Morella rubra]
MAFYSPNESQKLHVEVGSGSCEGTSSVSTKVMHGSLFTSDGIPEWFSNTSSGTSDITFQDLDNNRKWIGYAVFIDYQVNLSPPISYYNKKGFIMRIAYDWMRTL